MKKTKISLTLFVVLLAIMAVSVAAGRAQVSQQVPLEPQAMSILDKMASYLAQAGSFSVDIRSGYDVVQESGQKIEFGEVRKVTVSRPDRLRIEIERSNGQKGLVIFDGKNITIYTANDNVYATTPRQGTLDQTIKYAVADLKVRVPLAVMLLSTLRDELKSRVVAVDYVETATITGVPCDHLAARTNGVDFQVWIAQGDQPLPRRVVITYKEEKGQPQYWADLNSWNLSPEVSDGLFSFVPPAGAERIPFLAEIQSAAAAAAPRKGGK